MSLDAISALSAQATLGGIDRTARNSASGQFAALMGKHNTMSDAEAEKTAKEFESLFIGQMLGQMFGESIGEDAFGSGESEEVYKSLLMDEYGKRISNAGGIGIASYVKRELLKLQEVSL